MLPTSSAIDNASKVNFPQQTTEKPAPKLGDPVAPSSARLDRFAARVYQCAASIKQFVDKHPYESICVAMILTGAGVATGGAFILGAAILITLGALTAATGTAILFVMVCLDCRIASQKKPGGCEDGHQRVAVDLDDPDAYRIEPASVAHTDSIPQSETTIDLKPVTDKHAADDFAKMLAEIGGDVEKF